VFDFSLSLAKSFVSYQQRSDWCQRDFVQLKESGDSDFQHIIYRIRHKRSFKNASISRQNKNQSTNYEIVFNFTKYLQIY